MSWRRVSVCPCRSSCIFYFFIFRFVYHVSAVSARRIMHLVHLSMLDALWKFELPSSSVPPPPTSSPSSTATRAMHRKRFFEWSEEVKKRNSADRQTHLAYAGDRQLLCREPHCIPFRLTFFYHYFIYHYFAQQSVYIHLKVAHWSHSHSRRAHTENFMIYRHVSSLGHWYYMPQHEQSNARDAISACKLTASQIAEQSGFITSTFIIIQLPRRDSTQTDGLRAARHSLCTQDERKILGNCSSKRKIKKNKNSSNRRDTRFVRGALAGRQRHQSRFRFHFSSSAHETKKALIAKSAKRFW